MGEKVQIVIKIGEAANHTLPTPPSLEGSGDGLGKKEISSGVDVL